MSAPSNRIWGIAISVALVALAAFLVWLGAKNGPSNTYVSPSQASQERLGLEVFVGGRVAAVQDRGSNKGPIYTLKDATGTSDAHVLVEYTGKHKVLLDEDQLVVFRGTVRRKGYIVANRIVDLPAQGASLGK